MRREKSVDKFILSQTGQGTRTCNAGSRYYGVPAGIIDNTVLSGGFSTRRKNWKEVFPHKSGREEQPRRAAVPGREEGARQLSTVLEAQGFSWQAAPGDVGEVIKQVLQ